MTVFLVIITPFLVILAVLTVVDAIRKVNGGWNIAAWVAFIVFLPVIGSMVYWITRKASPDTAEAVYLANAEAHHQRKQSPIDRSGF
jgi:hypothetical protein